MKKLNLYLYFLCIAFAPAMSSGSDYDVICSTGVNSPCAGITEPIECNNKASCVFESFIGCKQCPGREYKSGSTCISCPEKTVTTPSGEKKSYDYTSCQGATSKANCYYNCDKYCTSMRTTNGTWSLDTSQYTGSMGVQISAAAYWDDDLVTKCKCKLTCKNANDYCSNDGENPNGYHITGSYYNGKIKSTCTPNWTKYTSDDGDTGFRQWDTSKLGWSDPYVTDCVEGHRHFKPQSGGLPTKCNRKYGTCESDIQNCDADFLEKCQVDYYGATKNTLVAAHGSIFTTGAGKLYWDGDETTDKWQVSGGCKCKAENVPIKECDDSTNKCTKIGEKTVVLSYTGNGRKRTAWGDAVTTVTSCIKGYYKPTNQNTCVKTEPGYYSDSDTSMTQKKCPETHPHSAAGATEKSDCYEDCNESAAAKTAEWKKKNTNGQYGDYFGGGYVSLTGATQHSPDICSFELQCTHEDESCGAVSDTGDTKYGYHINGDKCLPYRKPCSGGGVKHGWQMLKSAGTKYGECMALECNSEYHVIDVKTQCTNGVEFAYGTCVSNVQSCASVTDTGGKTNKDRKGNIIPVLSLCADSTNKTGIITGDTKGYNESQRDYDWSTCVCTVSDATQVDSADKPTGSGTLKFTGCKSDHKTWLNQSWDMSSCTKGYYKPDNENTCAQTAEGYYSDSDTSLKQTPCPAGSTSNAGATAKTQCYMKGGSGGTLFCDKHGCFNLPTDVQIFYAGD